MPIAWAFEPILRAFVVTVEGDPSSVECDDAVESILAHPEARRRLRLLVALPAAALLTTETGHAALARHGHYISRFDRLEVFIVVGRPKHRSRGRLTSVTFGETVTIDTFDDLASAITAMEMEELD